MNEAVVYVSQVRIERVKGPHRRAYLPVEPQPVAFGVHDEIAAHYGTDLNVHEPHAATLDYLVAAAAAFRSVLHWRWKASELDCRKPPCGGKLINPVQR